MPVRVDKTDRKRCCSIQGRSQSGPVLWRARFLHFFGLTFVSTDHKNFLLMHRFQ
jgi:hypothetical protein